MAIGNILSNTKTRTLVLLVGGMLIFGIVIAVSSTDEDPTDVASRESQTAAIPKSVKATPGEKVTPDYRKLQEEANIKGAEEAAKKGETFIPTLLGNTEEYDDADFEQQFARAFDDLGGKCSRETVAALREEGLSTTEIVMKLKSFGCSSEAIAALFSPDEIAAALLAMQECDGAVECDASSAKRMAQQGKSADDIAKLMKENGCDPNQIAKALKDAGFDAGQIAKALKEAGYSAEQIATALTRADFSKLEILPALSAAGFTPLEVAAASSAIDLEEANLAALLAQQESANEDARRRAQFEAQQLAVYSQQRQDKVKELAAAMEQKGNEALSGWAEVTQQAYTAGEWAFGGQKDLDTTNSGQSISAAGDEDTAEIIMKAGSIMFASLDTAVNSDEEGPILATIVSGPLKGSKLMGKMTVLTDANKLALSFTTINMPNERSSMGISAVAIDPDTARTAIVSDVDHHYLLRWGSLFASSFMEGYSTAVSSAGETSTTSTGSTGTTTTTTSQPLNGREQLFAGLAAIGSKWSEVVAKNFDRPNTITIDQGTGIGVLLTQDLAYGTDPIFYERPNNNLAQQDQTTSPTGGASSGITQEQAAQLLDALQQNPTVATQQFVQGAQSATSNGGKE